jgi:hypothetical protein
MPVRESKMERAAYEEQISKAKPADFDDDEREVEYATAG